MADRLRAEEANGRGRGKDRPAREESDALKTDLALAASASCQWKARHPLTAGSLGSSGVGEYTVVYTGSCLCSEVQFAIAAELGPIQVCHCIQCRKAQGGPFATNIAVAAGDFTITSGEHLLVAYESSPGKHRLFCRQCGSHVYSRRLSTPGVVRVRAGLINEPLTVRPAWHIYTAQKSNWWTIQDGLPQFPQGHVP